MHLCLFASLLVFSILLYALDFCPFVLRGKRKKMSHDHHHFPCLHCHPHSYIRMVQHLIERCLLLRMTRDDCIEALAKHASIQPLITLTVWKELLKENRGFFQTYHPAIPPKPFSCISKVSKIQNKETMT